MKPIVSVIAPVFNEAGVVDELVGRIASSLGALEERYDLEIVLVNDGSRDNSLAVCRDLLRNCPVPLTVVDLARNFGEHNAVMAGLRHASGAWVITIDRKSVV